MIEHDEQDENMARELLLIINLNAYIQRKLGTLILNGKEVMCLSLDRTCTFEGIGEPDIKLTLSQLQNLCSQVHLQNT